MKDLLKNTFPRYGKTASSSKKIKTMVSTSSKMFFFQNWFRLILVMVSNIRKKALNKRTVFPLDREQVSTGQNEEFV